MFIFLTFIFNTLCFSATHPLTGSSIVNQPKNSIALTQLGFVLNMIPENWSYTKVFTADSNIIELGINKKTILTFRLETVSSKTLLEPFVRQYLRDYNQYGFEVIGLQSYTKTTTPSIIVDLNQKNKSTKSRQVFYHKLNKIIIATCADETVFFSQTVNICNQILASFKWL